MTSEAPRECFVWIWLPGAAKPVVAGRLERAGEQLLFNYGRSYLERPGAIAIYEPELPLQPGIQPPPPGMRLASSIRDGAPDAWGRRVIISRTFGSRRDAIDIEALDEMTYLLESGSDRIGALDFQRSPSSYEPRELKAASLDELAKAAALVEAGTPLPAALDAALFHGSSIGGARPKALIDTEAAKFIAKFPTATDTLNLVKAEFIAMRLAERAGLNVAAVHLTRAADKDVLLVERFDRTQTGRHWLRKSVVSALTLFELDEMMARYASYETLCEIIRHRFENPAATLRELYGRLIFNILCGNTDDHARNHAAFWDGRALTLSPAYDICPQNRAGNAAGQAMLIAGNTNASQLSLCIDAAPNFLLRAKEATSIIEQQIEVIRRDFAVVCDEAGLTTIDRKQLRERQFLNPFVFEGAPEALQKLGRPI